MAVRTFVNHPANLTADVCAPFVPFIDPAAALTFFHAASYQVLMLNNRRLKIDWEKTLAPLPPALALAVHSDSTRNMYIGNIEDFGTFSEDKLKRDFGEYGDIKLVKFLKEKNRALSAFPTLTIS
jgi:hypothetical protein